MWNKWETWFKGGLIGLVVALIISVGIGRNIVVLSNLAQIGVGSCWLLTQCPDCAGCNVIGLMFNLIYGFLIGMLFGWLIDKLKNKKNHSKNYGKKKK